jgi:hypothetical protein
MGSCVQLRKDQLNLGMKNFSKEILFVFETQEEMWQKEAEIVDQKFCKRTDTYNKMRGGFFKGWKNTWVGQTHTEETKKKMSESQKKIVIRGGWKHSDEVKEKMSLAKKGKIFTKEHRRNISEANRKRKFPESYIRPKISEETRQKMSESAVKRGQKMTAERKREIAQKISENTSPEKRRERGIKMANARWKKKHMST